MNDTTPLEDLVSRRYRHGFVTEIEADIERTRARLAGTVDAIADRVKPANVARRGAESARAQVVDEQGNLRAKRVAVLAVAVAAGVVLELVRGFTAAVAVVVAVTAAATLLPAMLGALGPHIDSLRVKLGKTHPDEAEPHGSRRGAGPAH